MFISKLNLINIVYVFFFFFFIFSVKFLFIYYNFLFFINFIIIFLLFTILIAVVTLIERKILSLTQRRVGPFYVGYRGRLQFIADALKLLSKELFLINKINSLFFIIIPTLVLITTYFSIINFIWYNNSYYFDLEYNILYFLLISSISGLLICYAGWFSYNKYTIISSFRAFIIIVNTEILLSIFISNLLIISESFSFYYFIKYQETTYLIKYFSFSIIVIFVIFMLESGRTPFDLLEAESELVSGYNTEYGGFFFGMYYLAEYMHLITISYVFVFVLFGGWFFNLDFFLTTNYIDYLDVLF